MSAALIQFAEHGPAGLIGLSDQTLHEERPLGEQEKQSRDNGEPDQQDETLPIQGDGGRRVDGSLWHPLPLGG